MAGAELSLIGAQKLPLDRYPGAQFSSLGFGYGNGCAITTVLDAKDDHKGDSAHLVLLLPQIEPWRRVGREHDVAPRNCSMILTEHPIGDDAARS
jgi:hypothetical protein